MNKQTLKRAALISAISALTMLGATSCGNSEKKQEKQKQKMEQVRKEQKKFYDQVYDTAKDSLLKARGFHDSKFDDIVTQYEDDCMRDSLVCKLDAPAKVELSKQVVKSADTIINQYMTRIVAMLNKYNLSPDKAQLINGYKQSYWQKDAYAFVGAKCEWLDGISPDKFSLISYFMDEHFANKSDGISEIRKSEIHAKVREILKQMESEIYRARKQIEKKFACYYPILDTSKIPAEYANIILDNHDVAICDSNEGYQFGYFENWKITPDINMYKTVDVYDSKLDVEFFGEKDCKYELIQVAKGKWQVIRTDKKGNIKKSHVFTHNTEYDITCWANKSFSYAPGENMGVHVFASRPVYQKSATKEYPMSVKQKKRLQHQIDSLGTEIERKRKLDDERYEIRRDAHDAAEEFAKQKLAQKFGKKQVYKVR